MISSTLISSVGASPSGWSISGLVRSVMRSSCVGAVGSGSVCRTGGVEDVDDEDQGLAGELALVAVGLGRRDHEHQLRADGGVHQALVPAGDDLALAEHEAEGRTALPGDRKSTRLNSSHVSISYAVFCLKKKKKQAQQ